MLGQTISHYRIIQKLGEGAMGVVYLAEDTHLGRQVAIKFLASANEHHYRARFLREARAISTLTHRNIAIVYDYGETNDGQPFIVMEYVKGATLSDLLHQSALTITNALEIIEAVADALGAAHAQGIIHRDIKPSNVLVDGGGQVKVLDFGLAKQVDDGPPDGATPDANMPSTVQTASNVVVGTPLYLSPEQAMGARIDTRSDLFALGSLLYECLTGKPPFTGGSVLEIGAKIIHFNPQPPSSYNRRVSPQLDRITLRALEKKPAMRYQTASEMAGDVHAALMAMSDQSGHRTQRLDLARPKHSSALRSLSETLGRPRLSLGFFILALAVVILGAWYVVQFIRSKPPTPFQNPELSKLTNTGRSLNAAISPDGKDVVHVFEDAGLQSLILNHLATASNVVIAPPAEVRYRGLSFSVDGNYVYYVRFEKSDIGVLYVVPAFGGTSRRIMADLDSPVSFSPDGQRFAFVRFNKNTGEYSLHIAQIDGTGDTALATRQNGELFSIYGLAWSPDGKTIACLSGSFSGGFHMEIVQVNIADKTEKPITAHKWFGITRVVWLNNGSGLIVTAADESVSPIQIWYVSYPQGEVRRITNDSNDYKDLSITADSNSLVSVQSNRLVSMWVAPDGDAGRATQITSGVGWTYGLAWTPDGRIIYSTMASGKLDLWSMRRDGTEKTQLTFDSGSNYHPSVSADGRYIFFSSSRSGPFNIWRIDADGNSPKQLTSAGSDIYPDPSPDGKWVVYQNGGGGGGKPTLWKVPVDGGTPTQLSDANLSVPVISPDGKLIACRYQDEIKKTQKIAVIPFTGGSPIKIFDIPIHPRQRIRWTRDGSALTYVDIRSGIWNIWLQPLDGSAPRQLTDFRADQIFSYDWSYDGKWLACEKGVETNDVVLLSDFR
jgi:serine/threonine protein kinase/dipeptidyl aminopeptidase/acylaminoacyl peptidase